MKMVIKIKKKLYLKPRFCPDCGKVCLFCKHHLSQRCKTCHQKHHRACKNERSHAKKLTKYTSSYQRRRKRIIKQHPYCSLCGTGQNLTAHHVGGGCDHLTVLCNDCHQAYERWNSKRKVKIWRKKLLTVGSNLWKNTILTIRFRSLMCYYRIHLPQDLERQEAHLGSLDLARRNITN